MHPLMHTSNASRIVGGVVSYQVVLSEGGFKVQLDSVLQIFLHTFFVAHLFVLTLLLQQINLHLTYDTNPITIWRGGGGLIRL